MRGSLIVAWMVGEGIIVYRSIKNQKIPPGPGQLVVASGVFILLGILSESEKARPLATMLGWGFDIAAFLNLWSVGGPATTTPAGWPPALIPDTQVLPSATP